MIPIPFITLFLIGSCHGLLLGRISQFENGHIQGRVDSAAVNEASGLAASRLHPHILYTHNDKGGHPRVYALSTETGHLMATYTISGIQNYDWEDIAVGNCQNGGGYCIFIGEFGDHSGDGAKKIIYRIQEPAEIRDQTLTVDAQLHYSWDVLDTETLMIAPTGNMYIVSKVDFDTGAKPKMAELPASAWGKDIPYHVTNDVTINIHSTHKDPVGGDISPDGRDVLIKAKDTVFYWRSDSSDYMSLLTTQPTELPYIHEPRGESVCWDFQGLGYYTLSEGSHQPLYYYKRTVPVF